MIWELQGTESQNAIVREGLGRCTFPFDVLLPELRSEAGKDRIPIEWADLSRWGAQAKSFGSDHHDDHGDHDHEREWGHVHPEGAHGIAFRNRVLGLAWYSGKVSLDIQMESNPALAQEVLLAEGAHMIDFFYMTDQHKVAIWNALHHSDPSAQLRPDTPVKDGTDLGHGHSWFDVGGYYSWVGEAWMGLFIRAYSDLPVTINFDHPPDDRAVHITQHAFTPFFAGRTNTYHDHHRRIPNRRWFVSNDHAQLAGLVPCKSCKPERTSP